MKRILIDLQSLSRKGKPIRFSDIKPTPGHVIKPDDIADLNDAVKDFLATFYGSDKLAPLYRHQAVPHWLPKNYVFGGEVGDGLYDQVRSWNEHPHTNMATAIHMQKSATDKSRADAYLLAMNHQFADYPIPESNQFVISGPCMVTSWLHKAMLEDIRNNPSRYALLTIQTPMS